MPPKQLFQLLTNVDQHVITSISLVDNNANPRAFKIMDNVLYGVYEEGNPPTSFVLSIDGRVTTTEVTSVSDYDIQVSSWNVDFDEEGDQDEDYFQDEYHDFLLDALPFPAEADEYGIDWDTSADSIQEGMDNPGVGQCLSTIARWYEDFSSVGEELNKQEKMRDKFEAAMKNNEPFKQGSFSGARVFCPTCNELKIIDRKTTRFCEQPSASHPHHLHCYCKLCKSKHLGLKLAWKSRLDSFESTELFELI